VWFASPDLSARSPHPSPRCPLGPFPSAETLDQFGALAQADRAALAHGRWGPDVAMFNAGYTRLCAAHRELSGNDLGPHARLLRLGTRLWREGRRDRDLDEDGRIETGRRVVEWTPELVQVSLEWLALRAALARRRAIWLTRLVDAAVVWSEPGGTGARLIVIENGEIVFRTAVDSNATPPIPPGHRRSVASRHEVFTMACFDRLRVLTSELKRLVAAGAPVALRLGVAPALAEARLASALSWV
jgi:DNA polymerase-3 subunit epsilon